MLIGYGLAFVKGKPAYVVLNSQTLASFSICFYKGRGYFYFGLLISNCKQSPIMQLSSTQPFSSTDKNLSTDQDK